MTGPDRDLYRLTSATGSDEQAKEYEAPIGSKIYLIEFGDGSSIEIAEGWIEAAKM